MLWWFYKTVRDTDDNKHNWGTGYGGGGYGSGGRGGGYGGGGWGGGGGFGESSEEDTGSALNEEDDENMENLEEFVKMEIQGVFADNFKKTD